jgi:hypothetical protein
MTSAVFEIRRAKPRELPLLCADECLKDNAPSKVENIVAGVIPKGAFVLVVGQPKGGKTFFALDLCLHIATGKLWRGRNVKKGRVLYLALEGTSGIQNRVRAWLLRHGITEAEVEEVEFFLVPAPINLLDPADFEAVLRTARDVAEMSDEPQLDMIVVDTISRALGGNDENGDGMVRLVAAIDRLRAATGAAVLAIHHPRKDGSGGPRGNHQLRAAIDCLIEVVRDERGRSTARIVEARELEGGAKFSFELAGVDLGATSDGTRITSCVAVPTEAAPDLGNGAPLSAAVGVARETLEQLLNEAHEAGGNSGVSIEAWRRESIAAGISSGDGDAARRAFARAVERLVAAGLVVVADGLADIPPKP